MKAAQLAEGNTYEEKKGVVLRTISQIKNGIVHFEENGKVGKIGMQAFAAWAARPAGARKPKKEKE